MHLQILSPSNKVKIKKPCWEWFSGSGKLYCGAFFYFWNFDFF